MTSLGPRKVRTHWFHPRGSDDQLSVRQDGAVGARFCQLWMKEMTIWKEQDHIRFSIPIGPWRQDRTSGSAPSVPLYLPDDSEVNGRDRYAAELARQNFYRFCTSWRPQALSHGCSAEIVDEWIAKAQEEIVNVRSHIYVGVRVPAKPTCYRLLISTRSGKRAGPLSPDVQECGQTRPQQ